MTRRELADILRSRYESAKRNEAALAVHLFGIDYAKEIRTNGYKAKEIVEEAGMERGYAAELSKGIKLADHVIHVEGEMK